MDTGASKKINPARLVSADAQVLWGRRLKPDSTETAAKNRFFVRCPWLVLMSYLVGRSNHVAICFFF